MLHALQSREGIDRADCPYGPYAQAQGSLGLGICSCCKFWSPIWLSWYGCRSVALPEAPLSREVALHLCSIQRSFDTCQGQQQKWGDAKGINIVGTAKAPSARTN